MFDRAISEGLSEFFALAIRITMFIFSTIVKMFRALLDYGADTMRAKRALDQTQARENELRDMPRPTEDTSQPTSTHFTSSGPQSSSGTTIQPRFVVGCGLPILGLLGWIIGSQISASSGEPMFGLFCFGWIAIPLGIFLFFYLTRRSMEQ